MSLKKKVYPPPPPWRMCFERFMDTLASGTVWSRTLSRVPRCLAFPLYLLVLLSSLNSYPSRPKRKEVVSFNNSIKALSLTLLGLKWVTCLSLKQLLLPGCRAALTNCSSWLGPHHMLSQALAGSYWVPGCLGLSEPSFHPCWKSRPLYSVVVQSLSCVQLFVTPWTAALPATLSFTIFQSLLKLMSIESVMASNHLILCCPLLLLPSIFPSIRVFSNKLALRIRWPKYGASASASVVPMNIQGWFPLGLTGWISLQSKGLSRVFSNTRLQKHQFFGAQLYGPTLTFRKTIALNRWPGSKRHGI